MTTRTSRITKTAKEDNEMQDNEIPDNEMQSKGEEIEVKRIKP